MGSLPEKSTDGNNAETLGAVFSSHSAKNGLAFWLVGARAVDTAAQRAANDRVRLAIKKQLIECLAREIALKTLDYLPLILKCTFYRHPSIGVSMGAGCGSRERAADTLRRQHTGGWRQDDRVRVRWESFLEQLVVFEGIDCRVEGVTKRPCACGLCVLTMK